MIEITGYVARGNMPDITNLSDLRELVKWLDESWLEAKRDAEARPALGHTLAAGTWYARRRWLR